MDSYLQVFKILGNSIFRQDLLILIWGILTLLAGILAILCNNGIKNLNREYEHPKDAGKKEKISGKLSERNKSLKRCHTIFTTLVSLFPLLGMLGTVAGLINIDFSNADNMENVKESFFMALTSTAWGIIFSILFKFFQSIFIDDIEHSIEKVEDLFKTEG